MHLCGGHFSASAKCNTSLCFHFQVVPSGPFAGLLLLSLLFHLPSFLLLLSVLLLPRLFRLLSWLILAPFLLCLYLLLPSIQLILLSLMPSLSLNLFLFSSSFLCLCFVRSCFPSSYFCLFLFLTCSFGLRFFNL